MYVFPVGSGLYVRGMAFQRVPIHPANSNFFLKKNFVYVKQTFRILI